MKRRGSKVSPPPENRAAKRAHSEMGDSEMVFEDDSDDNVDETASAMLTENYDDDGDAPMEDNDEGGDNGVEGEETPSDLSGRNSPSLSGRRKSSPTNNINDHTKRTVPLGDSVEWQRTIEKVVRSVVSIRFAQIANFDCESALVSEATGFVVDAERGLIMTNRYACLKSMTATVKLIIYRHVVGAGPFIGFAVFDNHEEVSYLFTRQNSHHSKY